MARENVVKKGGTSFKDFNKIDVDDIKQHISMLEKNEKEREVEKKLEELRRYNETNSSIISLLSFMERQHSKEGFENIEKAILKKDPEEAVKELPSSIKWKEIKEPIKIIVRNKEIAQKILADADYRNETAIEEFLKEIKTLDKASIDKQLLSLESIDGFEYIVKELKQQPYIVRSAFLSSTVPALIRNAAWTRRNAQMIEKILRRLMEKKISIFLLMNIFKKQLPSFFSFISDLKGFSSLLLGSALLSRFDNK